MEQLEIVSLNVRGLGDLKKRRKVFNYLKNIKAEIICLQETHSRKTEEELWAKQWNGSIYFSHGSTNARGVCVLIRGTLGAKIIQVYRDDNDNKVQLDSQGRAIILEVEDKELQFTLCNIYAPNKDEPEFFKRVYINMLACEKHGKNFMR